MGGWLWICVARASETAAGANVGSHRNCNLITVLRISSCSGLKKMTRCSFWKSHSPCCQGNRANFHTAGVQGSPETVCVICTRRRRCSPSRKPSGNLRGPEPARYRTLNHRNLWWYMLDRPFPLRNTPASPSQELLLVWIRANRRNITSQEAWC